MLLENHLKNLILHTGPISMAEFMHLAMAHPEYGYYKTQEPFGLTGDFTTAPEISQMFGELIGIWCADIWQQMGCPAGLELVEIGPGRGTLMDDLIRATGNVHGFHDSISISMVETSPRLAEIQHEKINHRHPRIKWLQNIEELPPKPRIIVANELFDVLPVRQYVKQSGQWYEKMLGVDAAGALNFVMQKTAWGDKIPEFMEITPATDIPDGAVLETCPMAGSLMADICNKIKQPGGAALIIDYGYTVPEYKDTIAALRSHKHHNILQDIGQADISAHVDFGLLARVAENAGVKFCQAIFQGDFLRRMGIDARVEKLSQSANRLQKDKIHAARERLVGESQMGRLFKVMAVCSDNITPAGFDPN